MNRDDWTWPNADHLEWRNRLWVSFSQFIKNTQGFIPDSRDCHHKYLFEIYLHGADSFPMECVLFLSRGDCNCQSTGPDVDRNRHVSSCMVGKAQKFLGAKVEDRPL
jgi:hypothetical protein